MRPFSDSSCLPAPAEWRYAPQMAPLSRLLLTKLAASLSALSHEAPSAFAVR